MLCYMKNNAEIEMDNEKVKQMTSTYEERIVGAWLAGARWRTRSNIALLYTHVIRKLIHQRDAIRLPTALPEIPGLCRCPG